MPNKISIANKMYFSVAGGAMIKIMAPQAILKNEIKNHNKINLCRCFIS